MSNPFAELNNDASVFLRSRRKTEEKKEEKTNTNPFAELNNDASVFLKGRRDVRPTPVKPPITPTPPAVITPTPPAVITPTPEPDPESEPEEPVKFIEDDSSQLVNKECKYDPEQYLLVGMLDDYCILYDKINDKIYNNINKDDIDQSSLDELTDEPEPAPASASAPASAPEPAPKPAPKPAPRQIPEEWIQNAVRYITDSPANGKNPEEAFQEKVFELEDRYNVNNETEDVVLPQLEKALKIAKQLLSEMDKPKPTPTPKPEEKKKKKIRLSKKQVEESDKLLNNAMKSFMGK